MNAEGEDRVEDEASGEPEGRIELRETHKLMNSGDQQRRRSATSSERTASPPTRTTERPDPLIR
jgi:hypothetical protein